MAEPTAAQIDAFVQRWEKSGAAERANYALFLTDLCDLLGLPRPEPAGPDNSANRYCFERAVVRKNPDGTTSTGFIDLYKAACLLLESKQGATVESPAGPAQAALAPARPPEKTGHGRRGTAAFDKALERAFHQARGYITALPAEEGRPPFLIVCDVGHSLDPYAEFSGTGGQYERFPDPVSHRITLPDLHREEIRDRLRRVWTDPHSLDPSRHAAAVTREIAGRLAVLARSLEADGHDPQTVAGFLQRCLFTMFAEDAGLLPPDGFKGLLVRLKDAPQGFPVLASALWKEMATGTAFSTVLLQEIACFNGGLFEDTTALPLSAAQLALLTDATATDWSAVEPSIFGTLLVRALDPHERHKLGAEFTPRAYVERLIRPVILDPLREEWEAVCVAAAALRDEADAAEAEAARLEAEATAALATSPAADVRQAGEKAARLRKAAAANDAEALAHAVAFHQKLCSLRILDPACGTANFLYVTMEHMKRLEAEVLEMVAALGGNATLEMQHAKVRPEQFLGLEVNAQAVAVAQLVLWIGYFQWQRRTTGKADTGDRPLLRNDRSIKRQDAVLACDAETPRRDEAGNILTIWNGRATKPHPVTGKEVPDESARIPLFDYANPRRAEWPEADFIIGNPPFIGNKRMREALGDGYTEALRAVWKGTVPESADFVMFWWAKAAELVAHGKCRRFGFITTNSIHQTFNRRVLEPFLASTGRPLHLAYAIPDHPWIDSADGAAVRIAMTVGAPGKAEGILAEVADDIRTPDGESAVTLRESRGTIAANLRVGADVAGCGPLRANSMIHNRGVIPVGKGFSLGLEQASIFREEAVNADLPHAIRPLRNGRDITQNGRGAFIVDLLGLEEEEVRSRLPGVYQHVLLNVKPQRDQVKRVGHIRKWWIFGEPRKTLRPALEGLGRYIATVYVAKHRFFVFLESEILCDDGIVVIASSDPFHLGVLSSHAHVLWALEAGGRLGYGNDPRYNNSRCFETFPFPSLAPDSPLLSTLRDLGERLDCHRKARQAAHPDLTLTGMYNVLEALRAGRTLAAKEKAIHEAGLVSILRQIHDDIDRATLEAYGWADLQPEGAAPLADRLAADDQAAEALEQEILSRLVALNRERAAEESRGLVRWLRPDYQAPGGTAAPQAGQQQMGLPGTAPAGAPATPATEAALTWPEAAPDQVAVIRRLLPAIGADAGALSARFGRKSVKRTGQIAGILATLEALGHL